MCVLFALVFFCLSPFSLSLSLFLFFFFLSLSLPPSLSPSLSLSCALFFLPFLFPFFFFAFLFFVFLYLPCFFAFVSLKEHQKDVLFHQSFLFLFPVLFCLSNPFSYLSFFLISSCCFFSSLKTRQLMKHQFLVKMGVATKFFFFNNLCFAKCEKSSSFGAHFWAKFG